MLANVDNILNELLTLTKNLEGLLPNIPEENERDEINKHIVKLSSLWYEIDNEDAGSETGEDIDNASNELKGITKELKDERSKDEKVTGRLAELRC